MTDRPVAVRRGTYRGLACSTADCEAPAQCKGMCKICYGRARWASGHRPPSTHRDSRSRRSAKLKYRYGITLTEYEQILAEQGGVCAVCRQRPEDAPSPEHWSDLLCVDHCHDTGVVRGLLCNQCNLAVGYGRNDPDLLRRAAEYVATSPDAARR